MSWSAPGTGDRREADGQEGHAETAESQAPQADGYRMGERAGVLAVAREAAWQGRGRAEQYAALAGVGLGRVVRIDRSESVGTLALANDRHDLERRHGQSLVSFGVGLARGLRRGEATGAQSPGGVSLQLHPSVGAGACTTVKLPSPVVANAGPGSSSRSGHRELERGAVGGGRIAEGVGQRSQEGVQDRAEVFGLGEAGMDGGFTDSVDVDPVPEVQELIADHSQQIGEQGGANAACCGHPLVVDAVQELGGGLTGAPVQALEAVPVDRQPPHLVAEHVRGHILDGPAWADGGTCPVLSVELMQQLDERGLLGSRQRAGVDGWAEQGYLDHVVSHRPSGCRAGRAGRPRAGCRHPLVLDVLFVDMLWRRRALQLSERLSTEPSFKLSQRSTHDHRRVAGFTP
jgi:hypothetical protein